MNLIKNLSKPNWSSIWENRRHWGAAELVLFFSILILVVFVAVPVLLILWNAFSVDGKLNLADLVKVLSEKDTYKALLNSVYIATGVTFFSTVIGVCFAWLIARTDLPLKNLMKVLFLIPFMLPSFIGALAWKMLLSPRGGYINVWFMNLFGLENPIFNIYGMSGIIAVETMYLFPCVFLQVSGALERMDPTLEEAARISGAGLPAITRKITLPLVTPSIVAGALLVALYSLAHFGVPSILGTEVGIYNIPTKIYEQIYQSGGSFNAIRVGTILSTILIVSAAVILWCQNLVLKKGRYQIIAGKSMRPMVLKLRGFKYPLLVLSILYILITVVLPTVTIFLVGGLKTYGLPMILKNLTWDNFKYILFSWQLTRDAIWNSIYISLGAATVTMLAGTMISYAIVKLKVRGKFILEFLGLLP
ncbi:MAG TPA: iron ABC transporter permease, partial [Bacillota bacterium]|nr:iron ABC transporter permease [Bacillota bacterium]